MLAAAAGCGSSLGSGPDSGAGGHGGSSPPSCAQAPRVDCSSSSAPSPTTPCTLADGIAYACGLLCPPHDANEWCATASALVHGAKYTYIQFFNVDVWWISVYDQNGMLVAQLEASVNGQAAGQPWACVVGPADFDASEAIALLPVVGEGELPAMCGAVDAGTPGAFCSRPLGDDCSPSPLQSTTANICTLNGGVGFACNPCGPQDAGQNCGLQSALVRGARYSYVQILNVDVAFIYVYDQNNTLVAKLSWSANSAVVGQPWSCVAGPADFDPTEAKSLLPARSSELLCSR